jgi:hypothetical protein
MRFSYVSVGDNLDIMMVSIRIVIDINLGADASILMLSILSFCRRGKFAPVADSIDLDILCISFNMIWFMLFNLINGIVCIPPDNDNAPHIL